jgi:hypothetical protein
MQYLLLVALLAEVIALYFTIYQFGYVSAWLFAEPLSSVTLAHVSGHIVVNPFPNPDGWWQSAVDAYSIEVGHTSVYLFLQQVTGVSSINLFSLPFSALGIGLCILALAVISSKFRGPGIAGAVMSFSWFVFPIILFSPFVFYFYTEWEGYFLGYMFFFLFLYSLKSSHASGRFSLLAAVILGIQFLYYHTVAYTSVMYLFVVVTYISVLRLGSRLDASVRIPVYFLVIGVSYFYLDPNFQAAFIYAGPFITNPLSFVNIFYSFYEHTNFFSGLTTGLGLEGKIATLLPLIVLLGVGLILFMSSVLRKISLKGNFSTIDAGIDSLFLSGILSLIVNAAGSGGLPRPTEGYYFLFLAIPFMVSRQMQGRDASKPRRIWHLAAPVAFLILIIASSTIIISDPLWGKSRPTTASDMELANWAAPRFTSTFFADAFVLNVMMINYPRSPVATALTSPDNIVQFSSLYNGPDGFIALMEGLHAEFAIVTGSDTTSSFNLINEGLRPIPNYFSSYPFVVLYSNGRDIVVGY